MGLVRGTAPPLEGDGAGAGDVPGTTFQRLMATETRVLETVDRVVNDARFVESKRAEFLQQPLRVILDRTVRAVLDAFVDTMKARSLGEVLLAFSRDDRPLYIGLAVMAVTLCAIVLSL